MRRILLVASACTATTDPAWRLDHDRVVAVRAEPPHVRSGEVAMLDALLAHAGGPTTIEAPIGASAAFAPAGLFEAVHFNLDHWEIRGPDDSQLVDARAALGLAADAPVPLEVDVAFAGALYARKTVWLGDVHANPSAPAIALPDPVPRGSALPLVVGSSGSVRWLTSCGELRTADQASAELNVDEPCSGQLAVVVRDQLGGVAWQVVALHAE